MIKWLGMGMDAGDDIGAFLFASMGRRAMNWLLYHPGLLPTVAVAVLALTIWALERVWKNDD